MAFVLNTKLKIVFIVFAVVIVLYVIQFVVSYVNSEKKREAFEEESKPSPKKHTEKFQEKKQENDDKLKFQDIRLEVLEAFEDAMSEVKNTDGTTSDKHVVFNSLLNDKKDELVDAYQKGNLKDYITDFITSQAPADKSETFVDTLPTTTTTTTTNPTATASTPESQLSKKMDKVLDQTVALTKIEEIVTLLSQARDELKNVAKEAFNQKERFAQHDDKKQDKKKQENYQQKQVDKFSQLIEGFENTKNYASYI